ncbi:DUF2304 family protein [Luteimonas sp. SDU101]|uniref:DUF2304 family protein n=1 Tax=unclassified Luteimonas TaxID=2629088 RepID=UPI003EBD8AB5
MIQLLLTLALGLVVLFALREWRVSRLVGFGLLAVAVIGGVFVWVPEAADGTARRLGVGRGADLVLYLYCAASFLLILNLSLKLRTQHETLTRLARHVAIRHVREPERHNGAEPGDVPTGSS